MRERGIKTFINAGSDSNTFDNILDLQNEITAILGLDFGHIIKLYRFESLPNPHHRIISTTDDGSGVPITINTSTVPSVPNLVECYANIVIGGIYYDEETQATVMWNGSDTILPTNMATREEVFAECGFETSILEGDVTIEVGDTLELTYIFEGEYEQGVFSSSKPLIVMIDGQNIIGVSEGSSVVSCGEASINVLVIPSSKIQEV